VYALVDTSAQFCVRRRHLRPVSKSRRRYLRGVLPTRSLPPPGVGLPSSLPPRRCVSVPEVPTAIATRRGGNDDKRDTTRRYRRLSQHGAEVSPASLALSVKVPMVFSHRRLARMPPCV